MNDQLVIRRVNNGFVVEMNKDEKRPIPHKKGTWIAKDPMDLAKLLYFEIFPEMVKGKRKHPKTKGPPLKDMEDLEEETAFMEELLESMKEDEAEEEIEEEEEPVEEE